MRYKVDLRRMLTLRVIPVRKSDDYILREIFRLEKGEVVKCWHDSLSDEMHFECPRKPKDAPLSLGLIFEEVK